MDIAIAEKGLIVFDLIIKEPQVMLHIQIKTTQFIKQRK